MCNGKDIGKYMVSFDIVDRLVFPQSSRDTELSKDPSYACGDLSLLYINETVGWGLISNQVYSNGSFIAPYYGEFISSKETKTRQQNDYDKAVSAMIIEYYT